MLITGLADRPGWVSRTTVFSRIMGPRDSEAVPSARRQEILALAAGLFWDKGYHAASMNDVANAVGMRKASLYHHVRTKEDLLYEMSVSSMCHMLDTAATCTGSDPVAQLRALVISHVETLLADRDKHATALTELRSFSRAERAYVTDLRDRYDQVIDEAVQAVQNATGRWEGIPSRLVRLALLGMLNWTVFWFRPDGAETPPGIAEQFADIFLGPR